MAKMKLDLDLIQRGTVELHSPAELAGKAAKGKPLRVKLGVDPTSPDLHLGHTVPLEKMRQFQDMGHTGVLIIGDFTAQVGDPSGRDKTRPMLSFDAIKKNAETYAKQAFRVLDESKTELVYNSEFLAPIFNVERSIEPGSVLQKFLTEFSVLRILERDDFKKRREEQKPISLAEILYPLLQAYDSVAVKADVELGGNDQLFNLLKGREMQELFGMAPQVCITMPLLLGTDGVKKMSKSYGNSIALDDTASEIFGKTMKISDEMMWNYYTLLTRENLDAIKKKHPRDAKQELGELLATKYQGAAAAKEARAEFNKVFAKGGVPDEMPEVALEAGSTFVSVLVAGNIAESKNKARQLIKQGAVKLDGEPVKDDGPVTVTGEGVLKAGRKHLKLVPGK